MSKECEHSGPGASHLGLGGEFTVLVATHLKTICNCVMLLQLQA